MEKKLKELGFELRNYDGVEAYILNMRCSADMRFTHDFVYYPSENRFYINRLKRAGLETITEEDLIRNHNELNTPAKRKWLEIKEALQDFEFEIAE
jgi:hypothetical protein